MITKLGVNIEDLSPIVLAALPEMEAARLEALEDAGGMEMLVTAGAEGHPGDKTHSDLSLHYPANCPGGKGLAIDLSVLDVIRQIRVVMANRLGLGWDVILEYPERCPSCKRRLVAPHLHNERDPKKKALEV